jgi:probable HAF family extracellular repeat protein
MNKIEGYRLAALASALVLAGGMAHAADTYKFTTLGALGGSASQGLALNKAGQVVGWASEPLNGDDPPMEPTRPATWTGSAATDLGTLGGPFGYATGINNSGTVIGYTWLSVFAGVHATKWSGGTKSDLGTLGGDYSYANAINKSGTVVGSATTMDNKRERAVVWKGGVLRALKDLGGQYNRAYAISNSGHIVGFSQDRAGDSHAVMWKGGVLTDLGISGRPMGVNSSGQIVGEAAQASGYVGAAKWVGAAPQQLGCLATGLQCGASGINDDGLIVGWSSTDSFSKNHAAMWVNGVAVDLNDHLDQAARDAGWRLVTATAINSRGFITGAAYNDITGVQRGYLLSR